MPLVGDDEWDFQRRRRPSPRRFQSDRRNDLLDPLNFDGAGLHRSRSHGHGPQPVVNIFNDQAQDVRQSSRSPPYPSSSSFTASPEFRGRRNRLGDELVDDFAELALENQRLRSRSRGRSDAGALRERDFYEFELRQREKELRDLELRKDFDDREERIRREYEIKRLRDEAKRRADEQAAKDEKRRIIADHERELEEKEAGRKAEEKRIKEKLERDEREAKEKEKREYEEFLLKQKAKEEKEKAEKKKKEEEFEEEMRKRLARNGMPQWQIERMVKEEKEKKITIGSTALDLWRAPRNPVYAKVHRDYLSVDTLVYYDIPYEYDRKDPNYIIILREMDRSETDVLFEHTRRLRGGRLLLDAPKKDKEYAWYRKRDRSSSRVRKIGILEIKR